MSAEHAWPHIPTLQWELIPWWSFDLFGYEVSISNTVFSTWIFMIILIIILILFRRALNKDSSLLKSTWILMVRKIYDASVDFIWSKTTAQSILFLTGWMLVYILLANIFGLFIDWVLLVVNPDLHLSNYIRPMNSDPNTTFALSISVVLASHLVMMNTKWIWKYIKDYAFNFHWHWIIEKFVNVFLGWLHLISEWVKVLSLSLRLFWNMFAWIILIWIIAFLGWLVQVFGVGLWEIFVLPFWCFELFVAWIQALVFFVLASIYFKQATELEH